VEESRQSLASEISALDSGALRSQILKSAEQGANGRELANWYSGKIQRQGQWISLESAKQHASEDALLAEHRHRRASLTDNAIAHEKLARWCEKQALADQANVHWLHVLRFRPQYRAALNELKLSWYHGQLLARDEVEGYQAKEKEFQKRKKRWRSKASRLRRDLEQGEPAVRLAARKELRGVREPAAVPALLDEFAEEGTTEEQTIDCYDLIVDGFHTYFVGESGILAHDATPIKPTYVALPGISPAGVANAVRLVAAANR